MEPLYSILQITDSLYPSGSFAQSWGLEGLLADRGDRDFEAIRALVEGIWSSHLLRTEGICGAAAHRAMVASDADRVCAIDRTLFGMKLARELREASVATGRGFLAATNLLREASPIRRYVDAVEAGTSPGNYAVAFHATAASFGVGGLASIVAWGYQTIAQLAASLLRLGALGHRDVQALLSGMRPAVEAGALAVVGAHPADASGFAPLLEIASMRHERQYSRLFRS